MRLLSRLILTIPFPAFFSILFLSSLQMKTRPIRPQRGHYGFGVQTPAPYADVPEMIGKDTFQEIRTPSRLLRMQVGMQSVTIYE
jgi:hypothetical protein